VSLACGTRRCMLGVSYVLVVGVCRSLSAVPASGMKKRFSAGKSSAGRRLEKSLSKEGRTLVWVDESGFYLLPAVQRSCAPKGQTPVLRHTLSNDHLSAISAITPDGRLCMQVQEHAFRSEGVVRFLKHLLRHIPGKLLIIWDRSPITVARQYPAFS